MGLPANVAYCDITARFIRAVIDGPDENRNPDGVPIAGLTVRFAADLASPMVKNQSAEPPVTIVIDPIVCTTDENGVLLGPDGVPGVRVVASTDEDLSPHGWSYRVTLSASDFPTTQFSFIAPADGQVDLATVIPVPANPGAQISSWQAVVAITTAARDETLAARDVVLQAIAEFDPGEGGGSGGESPELRVDGVFLQWKLPSETEWQNLVSMADLTGSDGESPELQVDGGFVQWKLPSQGVWQNLISVEELTAEDGESPELRVDSGFIQWKLPSSEAWSNLVALTDLTPDLTDELAQKVDVSAVAALNVVGWARAVFITNGGTIPIGTPAHTLVIEEE